jgi:hypothetical protein
MWTIKLIKFLLDKITLLNLLGSVRIIRFSSQWCSIIQYDVFDYLLKNNPRLNIPYTWIYPFCIMQNIKNSV